MATPIPEMDNRQLHDLHVHVNGINRAGSHPSVMLPIMAIALIPPVGWTVWMAAWSDHFSRQTWFVALGFAVSLMCLIAVAISLSPRLRDEDLQRSLRSRLDEEKEI